MSRNERALRASRQLAEAGLTAEQAMRNFAKVARLMRTHMPTAKQWYDRFRGGYVTK